MPAMKLLAATLGIVLAAGCTSNPGVASDSNGDTVSETTRLTGSTVALNTESGFEYDPGAEFGVFRSEPLLEQMPFGGSIFGPWSAERTRVHVLRSPEAPTALDTPKDAPIFLDLADGSSGERLVQKDLHTVVHYIAMHSALQIIVEDEVSKKLTVELPEFDRDHEQSEERTKELLCKLAEALDLDYIEDGSVIIIFKKRPAELELKPDYDGKYNVDFIEYDLIAAIKEVSTVTGVPVLTPESFPANTVYLQLKDATPHEIFHALADLGNFDIEVIDVKGELGKVYKFKYRD
jgi:hypothetical protein